MKSVRYIYNDKYYKTKVMLQDENFKQAVKNLKAIFARFDSPIPKDGFKNYEEYLTWHRKYTSSRADPKNTALYEEKKREITHGKKKISHEQMIRLRELEENFLPPLYGYIFDEILKQQGVDPHDDEYQSFLEQHIFFNNHEYFESQFGRNGSIAWTQ